MTAEKKIVGSLVFGGGANTLGIAVVRTTLENSALANQLEFVGQVNEENVREVDILLVSLYWWEDFYSYIRFLQDAGLNPARHRRPTIIIGGMSALNYFPLHGYFHYCVVGDGEVEIVELIRRIIRDEDVDDLQSVIKHTNLEVTKTIVASEKLSARLYVEDRIRKVTRIEIARGCKMKCPFCQLSAVKPYRELPFEICRHLINQAPTKDVALFAPDRSSHSHFIQLEETIARLGKRNAGNDVRLDVVRKYKVAQTVRFGIEAFSERTRKKYGKIGTNKRLIEGFEHIFSMRTPRNKPLTTATAYMIMDLPGEKYEDIDEFVETMIEIDKRAPHRFTLFLSFAGFNPHLFTPLAHSSINIFNDWNKEFDRRMPRLSKIKIAKRGGCYSPTRRIASMLTIRGDERVRPIIYWLATSAEGHRLMLNASDEAGKYLLRIVDKVYPSRLLYEENHELKPEKFLSVASLREGSSDEENIAQRSE